MTRYLILPDAATAEARSRAAWTPGPGDSITVRMWDVRLHPADGSAALVIPDGSDGPLTEAERAALVDRLSEDWTEEEMR